MKRIAIYILVFVYLGLQAQAPKNFFTRFGGNGHDIGYGVIQTLNGQYAVTGSTGSFGSGNSDVYLALVDSMGWVRWEKSYGGFNNDIGRSIIQLADSGFVMAGYTNSFGNGGYDVIVVRTDKNGNLIWQNAYGGLDWDFGYALKATAGGDSLIVGGTTYSFGYGKSDGYILKLDLNGNLQWQKTYGGAEDDEFKAFTLTYNGMYAFVGYTKSQGDIKGDAWLVKTGLAGDSVTSFKYGNANIQFANDIKEHPVSKNFYLCGGYDQLGLDSTSSMLVCFNENGVFQFQDLFTYHERKDEQFVSNAYFKGTQYYYLRKSNYSKFDSRLHTIISVFDNNFYVNTTKYGAPEDDELFYITSTKHKGAVAVGYTTGFNANLTDVFLLKLDSTSIVGAQSIVGVQQLNEAPHFELYPTLTKDEIFITNPGSDNIQIKVFDYSGREYLHLTTKDSQLKLNLATYSDGVYFVQVSAGKQYKVFKVMKHE